MNNIANCFSCDNLEKMLIANWTQFIDSSKLLHHVLTTVQNYKEQFAFLETQKINNCGVRISMSKCMLTNQGLYSWFEFFVPVDKNKAAEGTLEVLLTPEQNIKHLNISGNILFKN